MTDSDGPTHRKFLTYDGSVTVGELLVGCTGPSESDATATDTAATDTAATADAVTTSESTAESTADGSSCMVSMAPMGDVMFGGVPKSIFTRLTHHTGMAFMLGRGGTANAIYTPDCYGALWNRFIPRPLGIELGWIGLYSSRESSEERLCEPDSDVHLADLASVSTLGSWSQADPDEIEENISPWSDNSFSAWHQMLLTEWAGAYEYYGLWEIFAKVAQVFQAEAEYEAPAAVHEELLATIATGLPVEEDRPTAAFLGPSDLESIYIYDLSTLGSLTIHTRPLKPVSMFGDDVESGSTVDLGTLLEADPDVILTPDGTHPNTGVSDIWMGFQDDPVGAEISAAKNNYIYAQGGCHQGSISNLFQLEITAKQFSPDRFGTWSRYSEGSYLKIPEEEQLSDRQRVADIINGDF